MKMCETCGKRRATFGLQGSGSKKRKWCRGCAEGQEGETERIDKHKMCEGCEVTTASYGLVMEWSRRWCANCCPPDAISLEPDSLNTLVCDHARKLHLSGLPSLIGQPPSAAVYSAVRCTHLTD